MGVRQGQTGVRQGIAIPARTKRQHNALPCLIQEIAESPGKIERERGRRLNLYFSDGSTNDGLDRNPAGLRLLFCCLCDNVLLICDVVSILLIYTDFPNLSTIAEKTCV